MVCGVQRRVGTADTAPRPRTAAMLSQVQREMQHGRLRPARASVGSKPEPRSNTGAQMMVIDHQDDGTTSSHVTMWDSAAQQVADAAARHLVSTDGTHGGGDGLFGDYDRDLKAWRGNVGWRLC